MYVETFDTDDTKETIESNRYTFMKRIILEPCIS